MFFHTSHYINHFENIYLSCTDKNNNDLKKELSSLCELWTKIISVYSFLKHVITSLSRI